MTPEEKNTLAECLIKADHEYANKEWVGLDFYVHHHKYSLERVRLGSLPVACSC